MKEKIITEQNIARFEKELKKFEKTPNTIHKYVRDVRKLQTYAIIRSHQRPDDRIQKRTGGTGWL